MDAIGLLCVSLGSSTLQLHDSLSSRLACACSEDGFSSQNGDRAWGVYYRWAAFRCAFFGGQMVTMQWVFIKKYFLLKVGSVCRVKRFTTWSINYLKDVRNLQMMPYQIALLRLRQKRSLLCCGFRRAGKAMGRVYQCWCRICREIDVSFQVRISHVLRFISICDLFTDPPL
jgi:hypothetical protein